MCTQTIRQKIQQTLVLKDVKLVECLVVSSHVLTLKYEAKPLEINKVILILILNTDI